MRSRRAVWLAGGLVLLAAGGAQAMTPFAQQSMARARVDAARELASVVLPQGARRVGHDPSVHRALARQRTACTKKYVVEEHHFWRIAGKPGFVWKWMLRHRSEYAGRLGFGELKQNGKPLAWFIMVLLPEQRK